MVCSFIFAGVVVSVELSWLSAMVVICILFVRVVGPEGVVVVEDVGGEGVGRGADAAHLSVVVGVSGAVAVGRLSGVAGPVVK